MMMFASPALAVSDETKGKIFIYPETIGREKRKDENKRIEKLLIFVNSGMDRPYSQYASYAVAFTAKKIHNIPNVMVYYKIAHCILQLRTSRSYHFSLPQVLIPFYNAFFNQINASNFTAQGRQWKRFDRNWKWRRELT